MRAPGMFVLTLCLVVSTRFAMADEFPYRSEIQTDDAVVMSGAGDAFYPTARLRRGEAVEVHRQEANGWYAIRPPQGSFSYVNALNLTATGPRVATVTADRVPSRVGSLLNERRDMIHVYLNQGEAVGLLETTRDASSGDTWCKISPPAGEFRWIQSKHLSPQSTAAKVISNDGEMPLRVASTASSAWKSTSEAVEPTSRYSVSVDEEPTKIAPNSLRKETTARAAASPVIPSTILLTGGTSEGWVAVDGGTRVAVPAYTSPDTTSGRVVAGRANTDGTGDVPESREPISVAMQYDLDQIDIGISRIVAQEPVRWDLTRLRKQADGLFDRQTNASERAAIRALLNKIDRYDDLHKRSIQFSQTRDVPGVRANPSAASSPTSSTVAGPSFPLGNGLASGVTAGTGAVAGTPAYIGGVPTYPSSSVGAAVATPAGYDSIGRLTPVVSRRPGAPSFALINPRGEVVAFVSPSPGVDLQSLVNREVGVNGARGFIPEFNKPHLTAMRATVLR